MLAKRSFVLLLLVFVACSGETPSLDGEDSTGGAGGTEPTDDDDGADNAGGYAGNPTEAADAAAGNAAGAAGANEPTSNGGAGGQTSAPDSGTPMPNPGTGGSTTLEPPAGVTIDWRACEPGGNCPVNCAERPARATHKPRDFSAKDFRGPVFVPDKDGIIVVEAEDLAHTGNWRRTTTNPTTRDNSRFTGSGYLVWNGYTVSGVEGDHDQTHQGNRCDWLVIKYWIRPEDEGVYTWSVRTHNVQEDGDNDAWHGRIKQTEEVKRVVTGHDNNRSFTFVRAPQLNYPAVRLSAGLHAIYVQGRSAGYGIDRIVLHPGGTGARTLAQDPARTKSKPFPAGYFPRP